MNESDRLPQDTSSPSNSLPPPSGQVGSRYERRSLCVKAKGSRGTASVRQSCFLKPLSGKHVLPQVVANKPKGSVLHRSASLAELDLQFSPPTVAFNFLTLNVNGIRDPIKHAGLLQWPSHLSCDFVCLQETHVTTAALHGSPLLVFSLSRPLVLLTLVARCFCIAPAFLLFNSSVELEGRFLMAEFSRSDSAFRIASVYAPNRNPERDEFFTSCLDFADPSVPTILCGDFNAVFNRAKDRRGSDPAVTIREKFVSL